MRLPDAAHTSLPWRIHSLTADFRLEDVWALPTPGGPEDFPRLLELFASGQLAEGFSGVTRALFAIRWKIGRLLGWDDRDSEKEAEQLTLRDRLSADLRDAPPGPGIARFKPLYLLHDEWAAEIMNHTVHGVLHLGWVPVPSGGYRGQLAVLVKPNGLLGTSYMTAITPFRHLIVYPAMLRAIDRAWRSRSDSTSATAGPEA